MSASKISIDSTIRELVGYISHCSSFINDHILFKRVILLIHSIDNREDTEPKMSLRSRITNIFKQDLRKKSYHLRCFINLIRMMRAREAEWWLPLDNINTKLLVSLPFPGPATTKALNVGSKNVFLWAIHQMKSTEFEIGQENKSLYFKLGRRFLISNHRQRKS